MGEGDVCRDVVGTFTVEIDVGTVSLHVGRM